MKSYLHKEILWLKKKNNSEKDPDLPHLVHILPNCRSILPSLVVLYSLLNRLKGLKAGICGCCCCVIAWNGLNDCWAGCAAVCAACAAGCTGCAGIVGLIGCAALTPADACSWPRCCCTMPEKVWRLQTRNSEIC